MRQCKRCGEVKELIDFYKHSKGYRHTCKACTKSASAEWVKTNPARRLEIVRLSRSQPHTAWRAYRNKYKSLTGASAKRRETMQTQTPKWVDSDMLWFIKEAHDLRELRTAMTGTEWHVDHIIPLNGKEARGLRVPWNIQVIPASENIQKGAKI